MQVEEQSGVRRERETVSALDSQVPEQYLEGLGEVSLAIVQLHIDCVVEEVDGSSLPLPLSEVRALLSLSREELEMACH